MNPLFIFLVTVISILSHFPVFANAQAEDSAYKPNVAKQQNANSNRGLYRVYEAADLVGNGPNCQFNRLNDPAIKNCQLRKNSTQPVRDLQVNLIQTEGTNFAKGLKKDYFEKIRSSLVSQYAAATWLGKGNPLNGKDGKQLQKAIESASKKCGGDDTADFKAIKSEIEKMDPIAKLGLSQISEKTLEKSKEFFQKRMLIAWIELNRIERFLNDRPLNQDEKQKLRLRQRKIRETYPLVANFKNTLSLQQLTDFYYGQGFQSDSTKSHPKIDQILFPDNNNTFPAIALGKQIGQGNEAMVNMILQKPLNPKIESEIQSFMSYSLSNSFESVGDFCELNSCQTMQIDLETTANKMNQSTKSSMISKAACSCNLMTPTEYVSSGKQLAMAGVAIGGLVLCPFTFGIGCYGSAAAGTALAVSSVANTYGALIDRNQIGPLAKTVRSLPGLTEEEKDQTIESENKTNARILAGVAETALGGVPSTALVKRGNRIFTSAEAFRPIGKSSRTAEELLKSTNSQVKTLEKMGVQFEKDPGRITRLHGDVKWWPEDVNYARGKLAEDHFGEILRVTKLPVASKNAGLGTKALSHPEMSEYLKKMDELGIELVVDTSLKGTDVGAYYWSKTRVIAIRPDTNWQLFLHEFQHAQFDAFIRPKLSDLKNAVQVEGKSLRDVLPSKTLAEYGEKQIKRLEKLLEQGHTERGMDETLSTAKELDALGWKQYVPGFGAPKAYGAKHRVNSLSELKESGVSLSEAQSSALQKGRTDVILTYVYNLGGIAAAAAATPVVVIRSATGAYDVYTDLNMAYNQKTGDLIVQTFDGRKIRTSLERE